MAFSGFPPAALTFLDDLARNNERTWFQAHKGEYDRSIMEPARQFVAAMAAPLSKLDPAIRAEPRVNRSIRRINRDTRFSADKTPYKDHVDFMFPVGEFKGRPAYWLRLKADSVGIGAGYHGLDPATLARWHRRVADDATGKPLAAAVSRLEKAGYTVYGEHYKRVPKGYPSDHPRAALLRFAGIHAGVDQPVPAELHTKAFTTHVARHFRRLAPLVRWLTHLADDA